MLRERPVAARFYRTAAGREPVREWLRGLDRDAKRAIGEDILTVQFGWPLGLPLVRKLDDGLWEVRTTLPSSIYRVLFTVQGGVIVPLDSDEGPVAGSARLRLVKGGS